MHTARSQIDFFYFAHETITLITPLPMKFWSHLQDGVQIHRRKSMYMIIIDAHGFVIHATIIVSIDFSSHPEPI